MMNVARNLRLERDREKKLAEQRQEQSTLVSSVESTKSKAEMSVFKMRMLFWLSFNFRYVMFTYIHCINVNYIQSLLLQLLLIF